MAVDKVLTQSKGHSSYVVDKAIAAMNADGDIFAFSAFLNAGDIYQQGDGILYDKISYEIVEIKGRIKTLTTIYAKKL